MKILLIGNYPLLKSQSMDRFAQVLCDRLRLRGCEVRLLKPKPVLGRFIQRPVGIAKWLWYADHIAMFIPVVKRAAQWADIVHICDHANAIYVPAIQDKPHLITCHDLIAVRSALGELPDHRTRLTGKVYQRWILSSLKKAYHITCVSETTRQDVLRLTHLPPEKVSVTKNGLNYGYKPMPREDAKKALRELGMDTDKPFFLHVGGNFFYKNRKGLLGIFAQILTFDGGRDYRLALVGSPMDKELRTLCQGYGIAGRVIEAGNISNQQLCALYSTAEAFIFPSLYEGFGWPIIEAQACGCPVFTSTRPPMTEVGGEGAGYFPVENEKMAAQVILDGLQRRDEMIRNGFRNARKFTTEAMVDGYIERYHHIVRQASGRCAA